MPEVEGLSQQRLGRGAVALLGLAQQPREPPGVDRVVGHLQGVAAGVGPEPLGHGPGVPPGLERPAQASDVRLERGLHPRRRALAPDLVDERGDRDGPPLGRDQQAQQVPWLRPAQVDPSGLPDDRELTQHSHLHAE